MDMKILSIDQSYTSSGIVLFNNGSVQYAEIFRSDAAKDIYERAWDITTRILGLAEVHNPDLICLEGLAFSKFGNATRDLAGLQFTIITALRFQKQYQVKIIPPNTVKKVGTGKGNAKKTQMYETLPEGIKKMFKDLGAMKTKGLYDLTDAYWIGKAGMLTHD